MDLKNEGFKLAVLSEFCNNGLKLKSLFVNSVVIMECSFGDSIVASTKH